MHPGQILGAVSHRTIKSLLVKTRLRRDVTPPASRRTRFYRCLSFPTVWYSSGQRCDCKFVEDTPSPISRTAPVDGAAICLRFQFESRTLAA